MDIKHMWTQGRVCIGLNKKVRLFLHGGYPIMAYYNPIILNDIPITPLYSIRLDKVLLVRIRDFWSEIEVLSNCKGFKLQEVSLQNFSIVRAGKTIFPSKNDGF
jgi:hypothetical protein